MSKDFPVLFPSNNDGINDLQQGIAIALTVKIALRTENDGSPAALSERETEALYYTLSMALDFLDAGELWARRAHNDAVERSNAEYLADLEAKAGRGLPKSGRCPAKNCACQAAS